MRSRGLVVPGIAALAALSLMIALGTWQLQRREWKEGLIARIAARAQGEVLSLDRALAVWRQSRDVDYYRVTLRGRFTHDNEKHLYTVDSGTPGWRVITPLATEDGTLVLVDRGFVPEALKEPKARRAGQIDGLVTVTGLARAPEQQGWFVPDNDAADNQWYWRDLKAMAASLDLGEARSIAPFFVEAEAGAVPGGWPRGGATRLDLPNRHLEYALTWYGLGLTLVVVFAVFAWSRIRADRGGG